MTEESIFAAAVALSDPAARATFLDQACAGNAELRRRLDALVSAHFAADSRFDPATKSRDPDGTHTGATEPLGEAGLLIAGRYKLIEPLGEGGMGSVWTAEQKEPVKRLVAVKLIKAGMDSKAVLARFEAERQALAVMDHPNIAKVLDGGLHDGRPYFVMELVKGVPITQFCDERKLTPRQRLELFLPVCSAIQHAHMKGVIHRDVKPSNVLVALYDDCPIPKVIDFGVAKATGQPLTDHTLHTGFGAVVGTPEYMSPEQASLNNLDVDTRSDVYALGVLLYELLTGSPPFSRKELVNAGVMEILRVVREQEPPRPSAKLSTAAARPSIAASRGTEPGALAKLLRGELDWLVLKAMEKDRTRRYDTANALAADVQRYLAGEPVQAHPPSVGYRLRKFVRRNRAAVLVATAFALLLTGGGTAATIGWVRAVAAERRATASADSRRRVLEFLDEDLFGNIKADDKQQPDDLRRRLDRAAGLCGNRFRDDPSAEAFVRSVIGRVYSDLGAFPEARREYERAYVLRQTLWADGPAAQAAALWMASVCVSTADFDRADELANQVIAARRRTLGEAHPDTLVAVRELGRIRMFEKRYPESEALIRQALVGLRRDPGPAHDDTRTALYQLAALLIHRRELDEAATVFRELVEARSAALGEDHHDTRDALWTLASLHEQAGRSAELVGTVSRLVAAERRAEEPVEFSSTLAYAGDRLLRFGRYEAAEIYLREAVELRHKHLPAGDWRIGSAKSLHGAALAGLGRAAEAEKLLLAGYDGLKSALLPADAEDAPADAAQRLIDFYTAANKPDEVMRWRAERAKHREVLPPPRRE